MNVSSAKRNFPKDIKSLKTNLFFRNININKNINYIKRIMDDKDVIRAKTETREKKYQRIAVIGKIQITQAEYEII